MWYSRDSQRDCSDYGRQYDSRNRPPVWASVVALEAARLMEVAAGQLLFSGELLL